tara:strand:- start:1334 stop:1534 length:201 start_codon:yes stop_codon:yes gene_type:complete
MESNLVNRFSGTIEGFIFALVLSALYWLVGFIIFRVIKKEIRTGTGYTICIIGGFVLNRTLPKLLM